MNVEILIGERICDLRNEAGLTQEELAAKIGILRSKVEDWELGRSKLKSEQIVALADGLNTSCDMILRGVRPEYSDINRVTGLTDKALDTLCSFNKEPELFGSKLGIAFINYLLSSKVRVLNLCNAILSFSKVLKTYKVIMGAIKNIENPKNKETDGIYKLAKDEIIFDKKNIGYKYSISEALSIIKDEDEIELCEERTNTELDISEYSLSKSMMKFAKDASEELITSKKTAGLVAIDNSLLEKIGII